MKRSKLVFRNLRYFSRSWVSVLAGVVIGAAVLTGALITGNSVRYSLTQTVSQRLGNTGRVVSGRSGFFTRQLAQRLKESLHQPVIPLILSQGMAVNSDQNKTVNRVRINGITDGFFTLWKKSETGRFDALSAGEALVSRNLAKMLGISNGDMILLKIRKEGFIPADIPFSYEKLLSPARRFKVRGILPDDLGGRFSLLNEQSSPYNVFVPLEELSAALEIPGFANCLLIPSGEILSDRHQGNATIPESCSTEEIIQALKKSMSSADYGLSLKKIGNTLYQVSSPGIFIRDTLAGAISQNFPESEKILTYLVNDISCRGRSTPYSFVTALSGEKTAAGGILINRWLADDLGAGVGDTLVLKYFRVGPLNTLTEARERFRVRAIVPVDWRPHPDELMPDFPGIKDRSSCRTWETGTPVDLDRIRPRDEDYWKKYKGTPRAYISESDGIRLWKNSFGSCTSFRICSDSGNPDTLLNPVCADLSPGAVGIRISEVRNEGIESALNSTDFGELFLSLGALIILAGMLLSGMSFSFFLGSRISETGVMKALGFRGRDISLMMLAESAMFLVPGCLLGTLFALAYSRLMIWGLNSVWQGAVHTSSLIFHLQPGSLVAGFLISLVLHLAVFVFVILRNQYRQVFSIIKTVALRPVTNAQVRERTALLVAAGTLLITTVWAGISFLSSGGMSPPRFLVIGGICLAGILAVLYFALIRFSRQDISDQRGISGLALKNAGLRISRSMTSVTLLALGTFAILITAANRQMSRGEENDRSSGTGGFSLWIEATIPFREKLNHLRFTHLFTADGDDASCLNLNRVAKPRLLGVPSFLFDSLKAFSFSGTPAPPDPEHPWNSLAQQSSAGVINVFADQSVITWGLGKKTGDTLIYLDENGGILKVRIAGGLRNSIFQGSLLVHDSLLRKYFPSYIKSDILLAGSIDGDPDSTAVALEKQFRDHGVMVSSCNRRLEEFGSVENTYLSVFMILGGLGILIGTIGLAILLRQNLRERRTEVALYSALGFSGRLRRKIIFREYFLILSAGLFAGMVSSAVADIPVLFSQGSGSMMFYVPGFLGLLLFNGMFWINTGIRSLRVYDPAVILRSE